MARKKVSQSELKKMQKQLKELQAKVDDALDESGILQMEVLSDDEDFESVLYCPETRKNELLIDLNASDYHIIICGNSDPFEIIDSEGKVVLSGDGKHNEFHIRFLNSKYKGD